MIFINIGTIWSVGIPQYNGFNIIMEDCSPSCFNNIKYPYFNNVDNYVIETLDRSKLL